MGNITIKDVAKEAGVSISTVSRYVKDSNSVNPISAVKIGQAIDKLHYVPNLFAQNLKSGMNNTIGVLVPNLTPYFSEVCIALSQFFYEKKFLIIVCDTDNNTSKEQSYLQSLRQQRVAGLIVVPTDENKALLDMFTLSNTQVVCLDRDFPHEVFDTVCENNMENAYNLTMHMIKKNPKKIYLLFGSMKYQNNVNRYHNAIKAINESGFPSGKVEIVKNLTSSEKIFEATQSLTKMSGIDHIILSFNPVITEGVTMSLNALGIRVGEDITLAGFTLGDYISKYRFPITRVIQNPYFLGLKAGEVLLQKLRKANSSKESVPKHLLLKDELIIESANGYL